MLNLSTQFYWQAFVWPFLEICARGKVNASLDAIAYIAFISKINSITAIYEWVALDICAMLGTLDYGNKSKQWYQWHSQSPLLTAYYEWCRCHTTNIYPIGQNNPLELMFAKIAKS